MIVEGNKITADSGMAIKRTDDSATKTMITEVYLSSSDSASNWMDCEYGTDDPEEQATEADKDAALTQLGVDMTEGN